MLYDLVMRIVDVRELSDSDFAQVLRLQQQLDGHRDPTLPVTPAAELRALFADDATDYARHVRIAAFDSDGAAAAIGHLELTSDPANARLAGIEITPADEAATVAVLAELLRLARADKRTSVIAWGDQSLQRHEFWTGLGAELRYTERESTLDVASVDAELMDQWIGAAPEGYRLLHWTRRCPEEWMHNLVDTTNAMNDAPTDDLDMADTIVDAEMIAGDIEARARLGLYFRGILAVTAHGETAGATEVLVNVHRRECSWQWNTVVLAAHRGRRIGRWMKAAMWKRLRENEPAVSMLHTGNAESNDHMLAINDKMGYSPAHTQACYQGDLEALQTAADQRL